MSFTTRCPSCGTMFRVVADQLKISEGWVRCGHCADVFDATLYLQPWVPPDEQPPAPGALDGAGPEPEHERGPVPEPQLESEAAPEPEPVPVPVPVPVPEPEPEPERLPAVELGLEEALEEATSRHVVVPDVLLDEPVWEPEASMDERAIDTVTPPFGAAPAAVQADDAESDFHAELKRFAAGLGRLKEGGAGAAVEETPSGTDATDMPEAPAPQDRAEADVPAGGDAEAPPDVVPGFVRQAQRQAFWASRGVRAALALLALVLAALLAGQWAVHERDRLAAWRPDLQPLLQQACDHLGCELAPMRRIDAIVIDSTSLVRRLGNFYSFDLVLKNTASMALAVPALELSLTDIGGDVISRRVFLPDEWPDAPALLPAQASVTVHFRLSLALGDDTPMAGYHALVFYP